MKKIITKLGMWLIPLFALQTTSTSLDAQCLPPYVMSDNACSKQFTQFRMDAIGATNIEWDFGGLGTIFNQTTPGFSFQDPGFYNVTLKYTDAQGNPCTRTISVEVKKSPDVDVSSLSPLSQCFEGNKFTIIDRSLAAPGSFIKRVKHVVAGTIFEQENPIMPWAYDFSTADPAGGFYDIDIEVEDANGCVTVTVLPAYLEVKPGLGLNFTSNRPQGCDSVTMNITNNSLIPLSEIASFEWDFGDGTFNTTDWGPTLSHTFYTQGPNNGQFTTCLRVIDLSGCRETFCFNGSATNLLLDLKILATPDSACMADNPLVFSLIRDTCAKEDPLIVGIQGFLWNFGDPDTGPENFDNRNLLETEHSFSKVGPFLVKLQFNHNICGNRELFKQIQMIGPQSVIPGPGIPLNQRYQCESRDTVFFPNESVFFHNDFDWSNDAQGVYEILDRDPLCPEDDLHWIYGFDSAAQTVRNEDFHLPLRTNECTWRIWDFDDEYAPRCTTDSRPIYPQLPEYGNMHMNPDPFTGLWPRNTFREFPDTIRTKFGVDTIIPATFWQNCNFSYDSLPYHFFSDWEDIFWDTFVAQNRPLEYSIIRENDQFFTDGCFRVTADTNDMVEYRRQFYLQIPRCYNVRLNHYDTCHPLRCESEAISQIAIMRPNASGMNKEGRYCFGGPPNYGVTFILDNTQPGCTSSEAYLNPDTALNPNNWIPFYPGGQTGTYQAPAPIMPYPMSGPYPNRLFFNYPNPGSIKDVQRGYAHVGLIIGNGVGANLCYDTVYYPNFLKFPVLDVVNSEIVIPDPLDPLNPVFFKICRWDSIAIRITEPNVTVPADVDQIAYAFQRIAPDIQDDGGRFPFYSYVVFENYNWYKNKFIIPNTDTTINFSDGDFKDYNAGDTILFLENSITKTVIRSYGNTTEELERVEIPIGIIKKWKSEADVTDIRDILDRAFESIGFRMSSLSPEEIATAIRLKCIDTTGIGDFIKFIIEPIDRESFHYRDTSVFVLDEFRGSPDILDNAYTFIAEENGIFDLTLQMRSRIGGCIAQNTRRFLVGFYSRLDVSDSIICNNDDIEVEATFRYFHIRPDINNPSPCQRPLWWHCPDFWADRENEAGNPNREGFTQWDWSIDDDNPGVPQTIFGTDPYGYRGYTGPIIAGGDGPGNLYYNDPGFYTMRLKGEDSTGCTDTLYQNFYATKLIADFDTDTTMACVTILDFLDSSFLIDPCVDKLGRECDEIVEWRITWGDNKRDDVFNRQTYPPFRGLRIGHAYTRSGVFPITLKVKSALGCEDSITKLINIAGPIPEFFTDTLDVCVNDSVTYFNTSQRITQNSTWTWNYGDGVFRSDVFADPNYSNTHKYAYKQAGVYSNFLTMFDSIGMRVCGITYPDTIDGSQAEYLIFVRPLNEIKITPDRDTICPGETVIFEINADSDYISYYVNFNADNGNFDEDSTFNNPDTIFSRTFQNPGIYMVTVLGIPDPNIVMCPKSDTIYIYVDSVKADFEIDSTKKPNFCFTNTSTNARSNRWGFYHLTDITETGEDFKENRETDEKEICNNYVDSLGGWFVCLIVDNEAGCPDTICKFVHFYKMIQVPNVFTPAKSGTSTGDGLNDFFDVPIAGHNFYELTIRNRWGDIVFKSDDSEYDWNGKVNNTGPECPDGTYIYILRYSFIGDDEDVEQVSGVITLIREK